MQVSPGRCLRGAGGCESLRRVPGEPVPDDAAGLRAANARLRAVVEAKDGQGAMLTAALERERRLELRLAEVERRLLRMGNPEWHPGPQPGRARRRGDRGFGCGKLVPDREHGSQRKALESAIWTTAGGSARTHRPGEPGGAHGGRPSRHHRGLGPHSSHLGHLPRPAPNIGAVHDAAVTEVVILPDGTGLSCGDDGKLSPGTQLTVPYRTAVILRPAG